MKKQIIGGLVGVVLASAVFGAYVAGRAEADGVPVMEPLAYTGTLLEASAPVSGSRNIGLTLWSDPTSTAGSALECTTTSRSLTLTEGRFRLVLDDTCVVAVRNNRDLWAQVEVGGSPMPRTHLGAVPYALEAANGVPAGTVISFAGESVPDGWLFCDGRALDSDVHPGLFAAIGTAWGNGSNDTDAATDFNLPDLRGRFLRGHDSGSGLDPDAALRTASSLGGNTGDRVGTVEGDATALPSMPFGTDTNTHSHTTTIREGDGTTGDSMCIDTSNGCQTARPVFPSSADSHAHVVDSGGDLETRPLNAAVRFVIRD